MTDHQQHSRLTAGNKFKFGIMLSFLILVLEIGGGLLSNSLALLSDAGHVFTDIIALSLSWYGFRQAGRPSSSRMTFGYHRVGVIIALVNAISIFAIAGVVFYEAYQRWQQPPEVNSLLMLCVAVVGLGVNIAVASWLHQEHRANLNIRSAFWHALGDALASIGVIVGGAIIAFTGWFVVDPIVSVFIGIIIAIAAWGILRDGFRVLLEATPRVVDMPRMLKTLRALPGVRGVHDIHVWSVSPEIHAMSGHVLIDDISTSKATEIRQRVEEVLKRQFDIEHTALQMECQECTTDTYCNLNPDSCEEEKTPKK